MDFNKENSVYQLSLYVEGKDILAFEKDGKKYKYRWTNFQYLYEWVRDNTDIILKEEKFPIEVLGNTAVEKDDAYCLIDGIENSPLYDLCWNWVNQHCWLNGRAGSILGAVYFERKGDVVEISWDNTHLYEKDGFLFLYPKGVSKVSVELFKTVMYTFCDMFRHFNNV